MCGWCAFKKKWDREWVGMGLEVCALWASKIKQDKERTVTGSRLCALCASKKKWVRERVGMGLEVCALCASKIKLDKETAVTGS